MHPVANVGRACGSKMGTRTAKARGSALPGLNSSNAGHRPLLPSSHHHPTNTPPTDEYLPAMVSGIAPASLYAAPPMGMQGGGDV